jgi:hypothetical protein
VPEMARSMERTTLPVGMLNRFNGSTGGAGVTLPRSYACAGRTDSSTAEKSMSVRVMLVMMFCLLKQPVDAGRRARGHVVHRLSPRSGGLRVYAGTPHM